MHKAWNKKLENRKENISIDESEYRAQNILYITYNIKVPGIKQVKEKKTKKNNMQRKNGAKNLIAFSRPQNIYIVEHRPTICK